MARTTITSWRVKDSNNKTHFIYLGTCTSTGSMCLDWSSAGVGYYVSDVRLSKEEVLAQKAAVLNFSETEYGSCFSHMAEVYTIFNPTNENEYKKYYNYTESTFSDDSKSSINVIDNLTSFSSVDALSANQGRVLDNTMYRFKKHLCVVKGTDYFALYDEFQLLQIEGKGFVIVCLTMEMCFVFTNGRLRSVDLSNFFSEPDMTYNDFWDYCESHGVDLGNGGSGHVDLTQEEYDALESIDENTLYIIKSK